ncbi:MAG: DUF2333 domain-containing protein [Gammaproteobacteria bacterium]|nr:MAG: DUF2333 domain-containing protein [Gammaproteobacteria bacterium]
MKGILTGRLGLSALVIVLLGGLILIFYVSKEPAPFEPAQLVSATDSVVGSTTVLTLVKVTETLLDKRGGYISNDVLPPFIFLDDMPAWEFGVLTQVRDLARSLRNDFSRSQTQSLENPLLAEADPLLSIPHDSWMFPSSEAEYQKGIDALREFERELVQKSQLDVQFYARADNLRAWLALVQKRLGGVASQLAASVGEQRFNTDLAGDAGARQSTQVPLMETVATPWMQIDDVFYEARGTSWALLHFLKAIEIDFSSVLEKKNARASLQQIILALEGSLQPVTSPMVLNGDGFGVVANYSLTMTSYMSRANAALIELRTLMADG